MDLKLKPFMLDRSLGLRPLGRLAFQVFAILVALILTPMVLSTVEVRTMVTLFAILVAAVALFFLSLSGCIAGYRRRNALTSMPAGGRSQRP
jgi:uncharacterized protein YacL